MIFISTDAQKQSVCNFNTNLYSVTYKTITCVRNNAIMYVNINNSKSGFHTTKEKILFTT